MSNRWLFNVAIFAAGALVGSAATMKYFKTKYEKIAEEEINETRELYRQRLDELSDDLPDSDMRQAYQDIIDGYVEIEKPAETKSVKERPYVIKPEDFGELDEYETVTLTYYSDKILADDKDEVIEDVDDAVGRESLTHFGEYEDDSVYVRNDERQIDYEILLRDEKYLDVINVNPRFVEGE